jgi:hypothetical protein
LGPLVPFFTTCQSTIAATARTTQVITCFTVEFTICSYSKAAKTFPTPTTNRQPVVAGSALRKI